MNTLPPPHPPSPPTPTYTYTHSQACTLKKKKKIEISVSYFSVSVTAVHLCVSLHLCARSSVCAYVRAWVLMLTCSQQLLALLVGRNSFSWWILEEQNNTFSKLQFTCGTTTSECRAAGKMCVKPPPVCLAATTQMQKCKEWGHAIK